MIPRVGWVGLGGVGRVVFVKIKDLLKQINTLFEGEILFQNMFALSSRSFVIKMIPPVGSPQLIHFYPEN